MKKRMTIGKYILVIAGALAISGCAGSKSSPTMGETEVETVSETQIEEITGVIETPETVEMSKRDSEECSESQSTEKEELEIIGNKGTIKIGTSGTPYSELLTQAKIQLASQGWDVQVKTYSDYEQMNQDVINGTLDAHVFAHQDYLDSYNDVNVTKLVAVADICFEKYGIYSTLNSDLTNITDGTNIGIPQDDTRKARALLFLQDLGYIKLREDVGLTAIEDDIIENPKNMQFVEYTQETSENVLQTVDYCVMGADYAILSGLEPKKDVLKEETAYAESAKTMAALLVTTPKKAEEEKLRILEQAIKSEETKKYMEDTYKGAWGLFP